MKPETVQSGLAVALRKARLAAGLTLRRVEALTGTASICRAESGQHAINVRTLVRLAECYGRTPSSLLAEAEGYQSELCAEQDIAITQLLLQL